MNKRKAIEVIISDKEHYKTSLNYAINYCLASRYMTGHEFDVQVLYILGNISGWRHPQAKEVRQVLRRKNETS